MNAREAVLTLFMALRKPLFNDNNNGVVQIGKYQWKDQHRNFSSKYRVIKKEDAKKEITCKNIAVKDILQKKIEVEEKKI